MISIFLSSVVYAPQKLSLSDFKINFNKCLGFGAKGVVYEVVKRPESEKNMLSYLFPYAYDHFHRVQSDSYERTDLCIKILIPQIPYPMTFFEDPVTQFSANALLREKNITRLRYTHSNSYFSYFKTRIIGKTLGNIDLNKPENFILRSKFVEFLNRFMKSNIQAYDLHQSNLMYDEINECWEIVDGSVEACMGDCPSPDCLKRRFFGNRRILTGKNKIIGKLIKHAFKSDSYSEKDDHDLLNRLTFRPYTEALLPECPLLRESQEKKYSEWKIKQLFFNQTLALVILAFLVEEIFALSIKYFDSLNQT